MTGHKAMFLMDKEHDVLLNLAFFSPALYLFIPSEFISEIKHPAPIMIDIPVNL
jgi:hypothetical protein